MKTKKYMPEEKKLSTKIRKGDTVIAIAGNNKGQTGVVLRVIGNKAVVQDMNVRKKHVKKSEAMPNGGIVAQEKPFHISNIMICTEDKVPVRLKVRTTEDGTRQLYYKVGDKEVVHRTLSKNNK